MCTCCTSNVALPAAVLAILLNWLLGMLLLDTSTTVRTMGAAPPVHAFCNTAALQMGAQLTNSTALEMVSW